MVITGKPVLGGYMKRRRGERGLEAAARQFDAWWAEVSRAQWRNPAELKRMYATASLVRGRVVFNISGNGNSYRLVARVNYPPILPIPPLGRESRRSAGLFLNRALSYEQA